MKYCSTACTVIFFLAARLLAVVFRLLFSWSNFSAVGSKVCMRRPFSLCTGEVLNPSLGVLGQERIANNGFRLSSFAFKSSPLQVFTAFSTFAFACGYLGPEVRCSNCQSVEKFLNSWLPNSGIVIADQHFRNAMSGKLHLKLGNYSLCCPPVNLNYFKEIGPVVYIIRNVCCPMTKRSASIFCQKRKGSSFG